MSKIERKKGSTPHCLRVKSGDVKCFLHGHLVALSASTLPELMVKRFTKYHKMIKVVFEIFCQIDKHHWKPHLWLMSTCRRHSSKNLQSLPNQAYVLQNGATACTLDEVMIAVKLFSAFKLYKELLRLKGEIDNLCALTFHCAVNVYSTLQWLKKNDTSLSLSYSRCHQAGLFMDKWRFRFTSPR